MASQYTIYLINQSSSTQTFWCFLDRPKELASDPSVFANSSASLAIDPNDPSSNTFTIPVQYVVAAGASNNAVGLNVQVTSTITQNSDLTQVWNANYANVPPNKGPKLALNSSVVVPDTQIKIFTNAFEQENNEANGWYSNQSFGIQTAAGFMGMTWSPSPNQNRTLTPKLTFYINVGAFGSSTLADWTQVGNEAAIVSVPTSFQAGACTITFLNNGKWRIQPGKPAQLALRENLSVLHSGVYNELLALAYLEKGGLQQDTVASVHWKSSLTNTAVDGEEDLVAQTFLSGTITVSMALVATFTYFLCSGTSFDITSTAGDGTTVNFTYNGTQSAEAIRAILVAGAQIVLGGAK